MADKGLQNISTQDVSVIPADIQYFTLNHRESPLARPVSHKVPVGCTVADIKSKAPKGDYQLLVSKGAEILDDAYVVAENDIIDTTIVPATDPGTWALIISLTTLAVAGYMLFTQEGMKGDDANDKEQRIRGLRNRERLYESMPVILGKRKVAPMFYARPWSEFVGEEEYFNVMLSAGYGPLKLDNFRIGEVPLSQYEHEIGILDYYGYNDKSAVRRLWQNDIVQDNVEIELIEGGGWTTRSTAANPDYISVEYNFPAGVFRTNDSGKPRWRHSCIQYQYQQGSDWYTVTQLSSENVAYTVYREASNYFVRRPNQPALNITSYFDRVEGSQLFFKNIPDSIRVTSVYYGNNVAKPARRGLKHLAPTGVSGNINVRSRKIDPPASDDNPKAIDTTFWQTLKTYRNLSDEGFDSIIGADRQPLYINGTAYDVFKPTIIVLRIKATNQLNGMLDNLYCDAQMVVPANWNEDWRLWNTLPRNELIPSDNPADAYRWLLQGPMNAQAMGNDRIDLDLLQEWRQKNIDEGWKISNFIETESTLLKELNNVAFTGRAEYGFVDGRHSVVLKEKKVLPVQLFTPRNSKDFTSARGYPEDIDGIKITFNSELVDFERDEIIFNDPIKVANPSLLNGKFRSIDLWGVTNPDLAYRHGRFAYYEQALRREVYSFKTDMEGLRCTRGDLVRVQNDIINVGYGSGRIKAITSNTITIDETVDTENMKSPLGLQIRTPLGALVAIPATYLGEGTWSCVPPSDAAVGDLVVYGQLGKESIDCIITEIDYAEDLVVNIKAVNAANEMYDFDGDPIPVYNPSITTLPEDKIPDAPFLISPIAVNAKTGVVGVTLDIPANSRVSGVVYLVEYRALFEGNPDENWTIGAITSDGFVNFTIPNLVGGFTYQFRARARGANNLYSFWSNVVSVDIPEGLDIDPVLDASFNHTSQGTLITWRGTDFVTRSFTEIHKRIQDPTLPFNVELGNLESGTLVGQYVDNRINIGYINIDQWNNAISGAQKHSYGLFERSQAGLYSEVFTLAVDAPEKPRMVSVVGTGTEGVVRLEMTSESVYPIRQYEVRSRLGLVGEPNDATLIGVFEEGNATFVESFTGTYFYHVRAIDVAGNISPWIVQSVQFISLKQSIGEIDNKFEQVVSDLQESLDGVKDNLEEQITQTKQDAQDALDQARSDLDLAITTLEQNTIDGFVLVDTTLTALDDKIEQYQSDLQNEVTVIRDNVDERFGQIQTDLNSTRNDLKVEINKNMLDRKESDKLLFETTALAVQLRQNQSDITNAIFEVDPETGTIRNLAYAYTDNQFTQAGLLIDGVNAEVQLQAQRVTSAEDRISNAESELLLQAGQINLRATYTEVNHAIASAIDAVLPAYSFGFFNSNEGWVAVNGTLTPATSKINLTWGDIENTSLSYVADENPLISISVERTGGTGWTGNVIVTFDDNSTQTYTSVIEDIPSGSVFVRNLNLDGESTYTGSVTGIRLVLGASVDDTFTVNSITIGKPSAALTELEGITAQINQVGIDLNALEASLTSYVTVDQYTAEGVTRSNVESVLNGVESYAAIQATLQEFYNQDTLTKANYAALWVDAANANIEQTVQSYNARPGGIDDQLETITGDLVVASSKIDAANGRISDQIVNISGLQTKSKDLQQIALQAEYQLYLSKKNQLEQGVAIAIAKNELNTISNEQLALAEEILLLEAKFGTDVGQVNATLFELNQAIADETQARVQAVQSLEADFNQTVNASVDVLFEAISNSEQSLSQQIVNLQTSFGEEISTSVTLLLQAISDETQSRITQLSDLQTQFGQDIQATRIELTTLVSDETQARIQDRIELEAEFAGNYATKFEVTDAIATETESRIDQISQLEVTFGNDVEAVRQQAISLVANEEQARIQEVNNLSASIGTTYATKTEVTDVVATETQSRVQAINTLLSNVENNYATISSVETVQTDVDSARANSQKALVSISGVDKKASGTALEQLMGSYRLYLAEKGQLEIGVAVARAETGLETLTTANSALAQELTILDAKIGTVNGTVSANFTELNNAIVTEQDARVQSQETLTTSFGDAIGSVQENLNVSFSNAFETFNQSIQQLDSKFQGIADATVLTVNQSIANEAEARADSLTALDVKFQGDLASSVDVFNQAIATEQGTRASSINNLRSELNSGIAANATLILETDAKANGNASAIAGLKTAIVGAGGDTSQAELILSSKLEQGTTAYSRAFLGVTNVTDGVATISGITVGGINNALHFQGDVFSLTDTGGNQRLYWDAGANTWIFNGRLVVGGYTVSSEADIRALDGKTFETRYSTSSTTPTGTNPSGWTIDPPNTTNPIYSSRVTRLSNGNIEGTWSTPVRWNGLQGVQGPQGPQGVPGSPGAVGAGFYGSTYDAISWTTATANSRFQSLVGRAPVTLDIFTQTRTDGTDSQARQYNGSSWVAVALQVNGSIVAKGTIAGDRFIAGTSISAPIINGGQINGVSGTFSGNLEAAGGTFTGTLQGVDGSFSGTVTAQKIIGEQASGVSMTLSDRTLSRLSPTQIIRVNTTSWPQDRTLVFGQIFIRPVGATVRYFDISVVNVANPSVNLIKERYAASAAVASTGNATRAYSVFVPANTSASFDIIIQPVDGAVLLPAQAFVANSFVVSTNMTVSQF